LELKSIFAERVKVATRKTVRWGKGKKNAERRKSGARNKTGKGGDLPTLSGVNRGETSHFIKEMEKASKRWVWGTLHRGEIKNP